MAGEHGPIVLASEAVEYDDELEHERPFGICSDLADVYRANATLGRHAPAAPYASPTPGVDR